MGNLIEIFQDNDQGYLKWLEDNPKGYVLNCDRVPVASYLILHQANCSTINGMPTADSSWTRDYIKVCSRSRLALISWANSKTKGTTQFCEHCMK
jgi:hypothetical protein